MTCVSYIVHAVYCDLVKFRVSTQMELAEKLGVFLVLVMCLVCVQSRLLPDSFLA